MGIVDDSISRLLESFAIQMADDLVESLRAFLLAPTHEDAVAIVQSNPGLTSPMIIQLLDSKMADIVADGETVGFARLRERRAMLQV